MVSRGHQHDRVRIVSQQPRRRDRNARRRVATAWFDKNVIGSQFRKLPTSLHRMSGVGHDPGGISSRQLATATNRLLNERMLAKEREELLGEFLPAHRPESRSAATRHHNRMKHF